MGPERKFDLVLFDVDGTLTMVRSPWQYLHERLGLWESVGEGHLRRWLDGSIDYEEFFRLDVELWLGRKRELLLELVEEIPRRPGAIETLKALGEAGARVAFLSTGFHEVAERIQGLCGFPIPTWANRMRFDGEGALTAVEMNTSGDEDSPLSKRALAPRIMAELGVPKERTLAVGDSAGDTGMFEEAGFSLAVHGATDIGARAVLPERDLRCALPWILG